MFKLKIFETIIEELKGGKDLKSIAVVMEK